MIFYIFYIALSGCQWRMLPKRISRLSLGDNALWR